jgi:hypothetical protein
LSLFGHQPFFHQQLKTYVIFFGKIFSDIRITRTDPITGEETALIRVPVSYSGRDKNLLRIDTNPDSPEAKDCPPGFLTFPIIGFEMTGMVMDPNRKLPIMGKIVRKDNSDLDKLKRSYVPVAYDLNFAVYVMSKNIGDGNHIIEQILPFFTPSWTSTVNLIPAMSISPDIPVVLDSVNFEDRYQGELTDRRNVFWTLNFTMLAYFYGPTLSKPIVKTSNTNFFIGNTTTADTTFATVSVTPGLDANNNPTSNAAVTIPSANIAVDDDFGYIEVWTDETDANTA